MRALRVSLVWLFLSLCSTVYGQPPPSQFMALPLMINGEFYAIDGKVLTVATFWNIGINPAASKSWRRLDDGAYEVRTESQGKDRKRHTVRLTVTRMARPEVQPVKNFQYAAITDANVDGQPLGVMGAIGIAPHILGAIQERSPQVKIEKDAGQMRVRDYALAMSGAPASAASPISYNNTYKAVNGSATVQLTERAASANGRVFDFIVRDKEEHGSTRMIQTEGSFELRGGQGVWKSADGRCTMVFRIETVARITATSDGDCGYKSGRLFGVHMRVS